MADRQVVLAERYRDALIDIRGRVSTRVERNWRRLGSWDEADVPRFLAATLPVVAAGQRRTVSLTDAYLARVTRTRPVGLPVDDLIGAGVRNGADPADVYARPFGQLWSGLSKGQQFADALSAAGSRVSATAQTDVQLSMTHSTREWLSNPPADSPPIIGYSRTLSGESCGLCAVASTQLYKNEDLMPIHDRCDCGVVPTYGDVDAAKRINSLFYDKLKSQDTYTGDAKKLKHLRVDADGNFTLPEVAVRTHGELGPVLTDAAHKFTSV